MLLLSLRVVVLVSSSEPCMCAVLHMLSDAPMPITSSRLTSALGVWHPLTPASTVVLMTYQDKSSNAEENGNIK